MKERVEYIRALLKEFQKEVKDLQKEGYFVTMDVPSTGYMSSGSGFYVTEFNFKLNVSKTEKF